MTKMGFWDYQDTANSDVKQKKWKKNDVATVHHIFRKHMGAVDQSDVKAFVMWDNSRIHSTLVRKRTCFSS